MMVLGSYLLAVGSSLFAIGTRVTVAGSLAGRLKKTFALYWGQIDGVPKGRKSSEVQLQLRTVCQKRHLLRVSAISSEEPPVAWLLFST
jgi:hypothetical protein